MITDNILIFVDMRLESSLHRHEIHRHCVGPKLEASFVTFHGPLGPISLGDSTCEYGPQSLLHFASIVS
jgi:hypothetical protein